jgi:PAS domain S-box-containing protein
MTTILRRQLAVLAALHTTAIMALVAWPGTHRAFTAFLGVVALGALGGIIWLLIRGARAQRDLTAEKHHLAGQLDRRINEIFSLQEMSYVLAESLQSERIAEQVVRYAMRFLQTEGAAVALADGIGRALTVVAAEGSLRDQIGRTVSEDHPSLIVRAITRERIEVGYTSATEPLEVLPGRRAQSGAAAPLRAHGLALGAIVVTERKLGAFSPEDFWLLSTLATHVSVVLANSRLFELVRQAKEEWETAFNALSTGIAVIDEQGTILRANRALATMLALEPLATLGRRFWTSVVGAEDQAMEVIAAARRGERPAALTVRSSVLDRILRLTAAPLAETGATPAVVVLVEDVTEQRALEAQLIQSEKLAAVGFLVSGVAHELNNPLASITGLSEFLSERPDTPESQREHLRVIREQAERAEQIVRNLLTFARKATPGLRPVDLNDLLSRTALLVAYEVQLRGVEFVTRSAPQPLVVRGNREELLQVLLNFITNALQALQTLPPESARRLELSIERIGPLAVVRVRDSGPGVPPAMAPQLFTPFFTTKAPGEGTGLGLSISYGIIESHGGRLAYAPAAGGGAEFSFTLPLVTDVNAPRERSALVSLVDSDGERTVRTVLEPAGYTVVAAASASEAMRRHQATPFPIVITDLETRLDGGQPLALGLLEPNVPRPAHLFVAAPGGQHPSPLSAAGARPLPQPFLPRDLFDAARDLLSTRP